MMSKFKPFDINKYCRVYFAFLSQEGEKKILYYERPQFFPDKTISDEAFINAEDMKKKLNCKELISIFIARTPSQVKKYESEF